MGVEVINNDILIHSAAQRKNKRYRVRQRVCWLVTATIFLVLIIVSNIICIVLALMGNSVAKGAVSTFMLPSSI